MLAPPCAMIPSGGPSSPSARCDMGAMKNWAMVCEELRAAREHWEQCNHANMAATRAELEAHIRLERAMAEHQRDVKAFIASQDAREGPTPTAVASDGAGSSKDAPGTTNAPECEETCVVCGKPVPEADWDGEDECVHPECEPERRQALAEYAAECRAEASLMFGEGRGTM